MKVERGTATGKTLMAPASSLSSVAGAPDLVAVRRCVSPRAARRLLRVSCVGGGEGGGCGGARAHPCTAVCAFSFCVGFSVLRTSTVDGALEDMDEPLYSVLFIGEPCSFRVNKVIIHETEKEQKRRREQGLSRPPLLAIPLSKVRVIAKDTLDYTFQRYTIIPFHRCIFEVKLRGP